MLDDFQSNFRPMSMRFLLFSSNFSENLTTSPIFEINFLMNFDKIGAVQIWFKYDRYGRWPAPHQEQPHFENACSQNVQFIILFSEFSSECILSAFRTCMLRHENAFFGEASSKPVMPLLSESRALQSARASPSKPTNFAAYVDSIFFLTVG